MTGDSSSSCRLDVLQRRRPALEGRRHSRHFRPAPLPPGPAVELVFALADAQLRLVLGGRTVIDHSYDPSASGLAADGAAAGHRLDGLAARLSDLQVLRDVYYLAAGNRVAEEPRHARDQTNFGCWGTIVP